MSKYNKAYVLAPYAYATGGVELAHQLVDYLREHKCEAYIVYIENGRKISQNQEITPAYKRYNIQTVKNIEDTESNILICPEIYFDFMYRFKKIKLGFWWMSVDNHYDNCNLYDGIRFKTSILGKIKIIIRFIIKKECRHKNTIKDIKRYGDRILHFYQSHYAQFHLYQHGFSQVFPLSDYINTEFINNSFEKRENIVLYNPAKGLDFTNKIRKCLPDVKFVALKNMSRDELKKVMQKSKLYIDFGHFPGKDRLPRECVINGCCIITGKLGASFFYEDVPLPEGFKFECKSGNISNICIKIRYVMEHYEKCSSLFIDYRNQIVREKAIFHNEIHDIFQI